MTSSRIWVKSSEIAELRLAHQKQMKSGNKDYNGKPSLSGMRSHQLLTVT